MERRTIGVLLGGWWLPVRADRAREQRVRVHSSTDLRIAQPLIDDFERRHPALKVDYVELGSAELHRRALQGGAAAAARPDVLWSSAIDLQIKLVNDGHAARHVSLHVGQLPAWAIWKHEAYGTTHEPIGLALNREQLAAAEVPRTHAALAALLRADPARWRGRVATYDVQVAGLGFLLAAQDAMATPRSWDLVRAIGQSRPSLHADTQSMLVQVAQGRTLLAYNVLGSYAEAFARQHPQVQVVYFQDYTLVASRVVFVARNAPNPAGARLWVDHLLSAEGQALLAESGGLYAIRRDATGAHSAAALAPRLGNAFRPITLGPGLLAHLDHSKHEAILRRWRQEIAAV